MRSKAPSRSYKNDHNPKTHIPKCHHHQIGLPQLCTPSARTYLYLIVLAFLNHQLCFRTQDRKKNQMDTRIREYTFKFGGEYIQNNLRHESKSQSKKTCTSIGIKTWDEKLAKDFSNDDLPQIAPSPASS